MKKKEIIEIAKENIHISFSEFQKYVECPHRHLIEKYLAIAEQPPSIHLFFGTSIHSALEHGFRDKINLEQRIEHFKTMFQKEMDEKLSNSKEYKNVGEFIKQGENILKILSVELLAEKYEIVGIEEKLYEQLHDNYFFKGFIDLIVKYKDQDRYIVIDWKTSGEAWEVDKKLKDEIFVAQMRFYKYFYARKFNVPFENIECKYIVLNRLRNKRNPYSGFGRLQPVNMNFNPQEIEQSLELMVKTIRDIHINKLFPKAKLNGGLKGCTFCPYKQGHELCNMNPLQYEDLLKIHKRAVIKRD